MKKLFVLITVLMLATMVLSACGTKAETPVVTEAPVVVTEAPPEVTAIPVGTADNPIIMALAPSATSQELQTGGQAIADKLMELTGYSITIMIPANYAATVEAIGAGQSHVAFLPILAYMKAKSLGYADVGLVVLRNGSDHYGFQFVTNTARVNADGTPMFTSFYDPATGKNIEGTTAEAALAQFAKKRPCMTDPLSASGYVIPLGVLAKAGVSVKAAVLTQGHPQVISAVYFSPTGELCDFGTTYIDARTAIAKAYPDVNDKVQVVYVSEPILPNDNVSFAATLDPEVRQKITDAFVTIASTEEGRALLKSGGYDIGDLKVIDDTFYDEFRAYLDAAGYDPTSYK